MTDPAPFIHRFRVRYSEVDPQGVVFNARYLEYADILVTEYFRALGIGFSSDDSPEFHVARAEIDYRRPLRADELVEGRLRVSRIGTSSVHMAVALHGDATGARADDPHAEIALVSVHVDLTTGRPLPVPDDLRARLLAPPGFGDLGGDPA